MEQLKFVHASDLHIDSPFTGLMKTNPDVGTTLQDATHEAFKNLIKLCKDERVDFLVVAGDVYDGANRSARSQLRFRDGLTELAEAGIQSFVVHGNHDPLDGRFSSITLPEKAHIFGDSASWKIAFREGHPIAQIQGISYGQREVTDNLAVQFTSPPTHGLFSIGILHCNVGGISGHDNYAPCTVDDLNNVGIDYWALGHIHTRETLREEKPSIVYPGNTQGRNPRETGARGCILVTVDSDGSAHKEFRELDVVRWESIEVSINGMNGIDDLHDEISVQLDRLRTEAEGRQVVCRVAVTGRGILHADLANTGDFESLSDELTEGQFNKDPWVWIERIINQTRPNLDIESRSSQDDFLGSVLRRAKSADPREFTKVLAEVYSTRQDTLPIPRENEIQDWIEEAKWLLAERLEPGE